MKLIIDIPKEFESHFNQDRFKNSFERILEDCKHSAILSGIYEFETIEMLIRAFKNGTPLPKGHGRLKDVDAFISKVKSDRAHSAYLRSWTADDVLSALDNSYAPTIIEADGGEEDGDSN